MRNRRILMIGAGIAGVFLLVCIVCIVLVFNTASSSSFQATATAQASALVTESTQPSPSASTPTTVALSAQMPPPTPLPPTATSMPPSATRSSTATPVPVKVSAKQTVNVRAGLGTQFALVGQLPANTNAVVIGKSADGQWYQIAFPSATNPGWVSASVVSLASPPDSTIATLVLKPTSTQPSGTSQTSVREQKLTGRGNATLLKVTLTDTLAIFRMQHTGKSLFQVELFNEKGEKVDSLVIATGRFDGAKAVGIEQNGTHFLNVTADGSWTISVEQTASSRVVSKLPQTFSGQGQQVSPLFWLEQGQVRFAMESKARKNENLYFGVSLLDGEGYFTVGAELSSRTLKTV